MNNKFVKTMIAMIAAGGILAFLGKLVNLWNFGFKAGSLVGLLAVVPASVWVWKKGINYINSAIYFAGIGYIMFRNLFGEITLRFVILCVLLALMAIAVGAAGEIFKKDETKILKGQENNG